MPFPQDLHYKCITVNIFLLFLQTQGQVKANFSDLQLATVPNHKEKSAKFVFYGSFGILPQEGDVTLSETHRDSRRLPS